MTMIESYIETTYSSRSKSAGSRSPAAISSAISSAESSLSCLSNSLAFTAFSRAASSSARSSSTLRFLSEIVTHLTVQGSQNTNIKNINSKTCVNANSK